MPCVPCWQQRQMFVAAWRQGNPYAMAQAVRGGVHIAADKYIRGIKPAFPSVERQRRGGSGFHRAMPSRIMLA